MSPYNVERLGEALFEETGDALFLFDPETEQILDANPMAQRLTEFSHAELLAMSVFYLFRSETKGGLNRLRQAARETRIFHSQEGFFLRSQRDGVWVPVNVTITRLHVKPKTLSLITARDVHEQREVHLQLKKVEEELRRLMTSVSAGLWSAEIDEQSDWAYRYVSPVVGRIMGRPPDFFRAGLPRWRETIHPDDRPVWEKVIARLRAGEASQEEYRVVWPDGTVHWVRDSVLVTRGADDRTLRLDGVVTDVTARREAEEERDRFFQLSLDMLCVAGFDGYFKRLNPVWEKTLGWTNEELCGRPYLEFVHDDDREATVAEARKLAAGSLTISFENRYLCKDGTYRWLLWNAAPFTSRQLIYAAARDITDRKRVEEELKRTARELAGSNQQLQQLAGDLEKAATSDRLAHQELKKAQSRLVQSEKLVALGQMVAGVAHEINNPLSFVGNNLAVLQRDVKALHELLCLYHDAEELLAEQQPSMLQRIRACSDRIDVPYTLANLEGLVGRSRDGLRRIQQIVKDLRDFARLDESDLHEVDVNAGIASTVNIARGRAAKKRLELVLDLKPLPPVMCYPAKINQVVLNLVANAIDACSEGGKVTIRSCPADGGVAIHVLDDGHGIDPAIRDRIFDPFFTTRPFGQGTGLGLSISHGIVEDHGGRVEVESAPGEGAHFTVYLPLEPPARRSW